MKIKLTIYILLILSITSCNRNSLKKFYYQTDDKRSVVFKYSIDSSNDEYEYWRVSSIPSENKLITESFRSDLKLYNTFEETISKEGADLIKYVEYERSENNEEKIIEAKILSKDVYKWNSDKRYKYAVSFKNKYGRMRMDKERIFIGFEKTKIGNKVYETAKFKEEYVIDAIDYIDKYKFHQFSYYAKNIGMVKYERYLPDGGRRILELEAILNEKEFELIRKKASH